MPKGALYESEETMTAMNSTQSEVLAELRRMVDKGQIDAETLFPFTLAMLADLMVKLQNMEERIAPLGKIQQSLTAFQNHQHDEKYATKAECNAHVVELKALSDEIKAWKNRAIGIGIGAAISGSVVGAIIGRVIAAIP